MKRIWLVRENCSELLNADNQKAEDERIVQQAAGETSSEIRPERNVIHWFRRGLRFQDNPALLDSLKTATSLRCVYFIDTWLTVTKTSINKWRFLLQCLEDLDLCLRKFGSRLYVIRGQPTSLFPTFFKEWNTHVLSFEEDPEPFGAKRDQAIRRIAANLGVEVLERCSHTLYDTKKLLECSGGHAPLTFKGFQLLIKKFGKPEHPTAALTSVHLLGVALPVAADHEEKFKVPTLSDLGFEDSEENPAAWKGGETEAIERLIRHLERKVWVASFEKPRMSPKSLFASCSGLSPYLRFGCLSARMFFWRLYDLYKKVRKSEPPLGLHGQLLWREFFYTVASNNPHFDRIEGNSLCVQIAWDKNPKALAKWAEGCTGFPWIDAIMRQLRLEGWVHHLARHAVACFLTRGDLWISWEEGMKVFDELILDADWSSNAGFWQWLSCSSFFQQFFHNYCPVGFGKRIDPNGDYVRQYVPALKQMPTRYIYEPWRAPLHTQEAAGCVLGRDYPLPMINHRDASRTNWARLQIIYKNVHIKSQTVMRKLISTADHNKITMLATRAPPCTCANDDTRSGKSDSDRCESMCDNSERRNEMRKQKIETDVPSCESVETNLEKVD